jgi:hypothetical protein
MAMRPRMALAGVAFAVAGAAAEAEAIELRDFFGTYVGVAEARDLQTGSVQERDMDIVVEPYDRDGFRVEWINVTRVDGRRDVPGVQRNVSEVRFKPASGQDFYVEVPRPNPFREREATTPMRGDPVRWAALDGNSLYVYSFVVLDDGRYELHVYERERTDRGIDLRFQRLVDGEPMREITGTTVAVGTTVPEPDGKNMTTTCVRGSASFAKCLNCLGLRH